MSLLATLHTGPTCTMKYEDPGQFTGAWMKGTDGTFLLPIHCLV